MRTATYPFFLDVNAELLRGEARTELLRLRDFDNQCPLSSRLSLEK